ncbi:hypothetical protein ACH5RR_023781 [Cinchona calisaya]|uniref:Uncharacterized protein n=1 Tax=Cinchona calisaya TaxID=153742 RepID=A0ABD2ZD33_9GENT
MEDKSSQQHACIVNRTFSEYEMEKLISNYGNDSKEEYPMIVQQCGVGSTLGKVTRTSGWRLGPTCCHVSMHLHACAREAMQVSSVTFYYTSFSLSLSSIV